MDSKTTFQDLTPNKEANSPVYDEAIKYALNNKSIRNVAISGAYGAGKSSVLLSYESRHKEKRFLHISLAHFEDTKEIQQEREKESVLEGKILNQLLHQLNQKDIPQTNFRVKREIAKRQIVFWSMVAVLYSLLWLFMVKYDSWCQYFNTLPEGGWHWLHFLTAEWMPIVIGIVIFLLSCFFLYKLLREQVNRGFLKKLSVKGNEIELFAQSEDSFFDKYLNEVLYLFSHAQADVIVFEDLDRFEINRIFERLHEINSLVNQQREKDGKTPLKFFYLLRDDIFTSKDRTKFFDFIIPVVPVVDGSNSYDKLKEILEQNDCLERFEEHFLMDISLYIDEMRVLKNICNEFFVYIRSLNTTELDYNKMFALIVYKNLFPKDFGELQLNRGYVYSLFARKDQFAEKEICRLQEEIAEKNRNLITYQGEIARDQSELDAIYEKKKQPSYGYNLSPKDRAEYSRRLKVINERDNTSIDALRREIDALQKHCAQLSNSPLKDTITRENETDFFTPEQTEKDHSEITNSNYFSLLKYLLRMGYIDETHADYMTYFYENSLCASDKIFLRSVTDQKAKEAEYPLKDPRLVFSRLRPMQFLQEEALNYDLLDYLLETESHSESTANLFAQLRDRGNYDFVVAYYDRAEKKNRFVQSANNLWPELFSELVEQDNVSADLLKDYSVRTLYICTEEVISAVNKDDALADFISNKEDYLHIEDPQIEKLMDGFRLLSVSFVRLDTMVSNPDLLDRVFEVGLYRLNYANIASFLREKLYGVDDASIRERNYSFIREMKDCSLYKKVHENMEDYIQMILMHCAGPITDSEEAILEILNCDEISEETKERYIKLLSNLTHIRSLRAVTNQNLWSTLLQSHTLMVSEENILDYYEYIGSITPELSAFINRSSHRLRFNRTGENYSEELVSNFFDEFVSNADIEDEQYRRTLLDFNRQIPAFTGRGLPKRKIEILIEGHILPMNADNLHFIRHNYPQSTMNYIIKNLDAYIELMTDELFSMDELLLILKTYGIIEEKLRLLNFAHEPIPTLEKDYSPPVKCRILQKNLVLDEMPTYFFNYPQEAELVQQCIYEFAVTNCDLLAENTDRASDELLRRIFESSIETEKKVRILASCALLREQEEFEAYLTLVGIRGLEKVFRLPPGRSFQITTPYQDVLEAMKQRGWIRKYTETNLIQYRVIVA